jgi:hypothetical protein
MTAPSESLKKTPKESRSAGSADWKRAFLWGDEAAANVDLAVVGRKGRMVRRPRHRFFRLYATKLGRGLGQ